MLCSTAEQLWEDIVATYFFETITAGQVAGPVYDFGNRERRQVEPALVMSARPPIPSPPPLLGGNLRAKERITVDRPEMGQKRIRGDP